MRGAGRGLALLGPALAFAYLVLTGLNLSATEVLAAPDPCPSDAPWESLCNVEPELRRPYLRLERVVELTYYRERISGMVRNRRVSIEWDWSVTDRSRLGGFNRRTHQVLLPAHLRGGPDRAEAAIIAHELWHAYADHVGWFKPLTMQNCLEDEREAFKVGLLFYVRPHAAEEPDESTGEADGYLWLLAREWYRRGGSEAALEDLAQEHVSGGGFYSFLCALVESGLE